MYLKNKKYYVYVVRNAGCARSRYTLTLSLYFFEWIDEQSISRTAHPPLKRRILKGITFLGIIWGHKLLIAIVYVNLNNSLNNVNILRAIFVAFAKIVPEYFAILTHLYTNRQCKEITSRYQDSRNKNNEIFFLKLKREIIIFVFRRDFSCLVCEQRNGYWLKIFK